jgi:hypothetical protein
MQFCLSLFVYSVTEGYMNGSVGLMTNLWTEWKTNSLSVIWVAKMFTFIASRLSLKPTQRPTQWITVAISPLIKRTECECDHSPPYKYNFVTKWQGDFRESMRVIEKQLWIFQTKLGAGTAQSVCDWLRAGRLRVRGASPIRGKISALHVVQTGSGADPGSCPLGTGDFFSGKSAGAWSLPLTTN